MEKKFNFDKKLSNEELKELSNHFITLSPMETMKLLLSIGNDVRGGMAIDEKGHDRKEQEIVEHNLKGLYSITPENNVKLHMQKAILDEEVQVSFLGENKEDK
jgi:hypothetical protein